jgi:2'-5' RNA ligase
VARACLDDALAPLRGSPGEPRWIPSGRWHLTLLFLGTVPVERVPLLVAAAAPVVAAAPPMTLRLAGGGRFGSSRRPLVLWVGLDGDVPALTGLARGLADAARALHLPVEDRPFRAHLTVGRWRPRQPADATLPSLLADHRGPAWPVTEVRVLESHLGPSPTYETLAAYPVG